MSDHVFVFRGIDFVSFYNFSIDVWNCSDIVVFTYSLTLPLFIEVSVPSKEREWSCILCVIDFACFYDLDFDFGTAPTVGHFLGFISLYFHMY